ncbi:phosphoenolpyruvate--protein phosphotransferase [Desulfovibrio inopinatus]|uniref:phosphoenolpyruvate--protein phosphotransferase n=1 Tax=Desulfovibrio inopinatus TaxID=102109 RepID=UPI000401921A|nr:phosphoenolpyruvate--protein phosphotransferase [Desulfovibrio inopinatus]
MAKHILRGIAISVGISIGKAFFLNRSHYRILPRQTLSQAALPHEEARLENAFRDADSELSAIRERMPAELRDHVMIIDSHLMILRDPKLAGKAIGHVKELGINAEWALEKAVAEIEEAFNALDDPYFRERVQDVRLVAERVMAKLAGDTEEMRAIESRVVLMAYDLTPADTVEMETSKIMSFVTVQGGKTSHTGILARSLAIPAVVGVTELEDYVSDGQLVIVDALKGIILVEPSEEELARYSDLKYKFEDYQAQIFRTCHLPGETIDGYRVKVLANIERFEEVTSAIDNGGEGIGLYRTEYSYLNRKTLPTEDELYEEYKDLAAIMSPKRVVLRTLDLGADKFMAHFGTLEEQNPAMGLRAIRFCLRHTDLFRTQMRAILRAATTGNIAIMFPMISSLSEVRQAMHQLRQCVASLRKDGIAHNADLPIGIMIELPSAIMIAEVLAREVDFFSIGTNDLIQYTLGIDRTNRYVSHLYQPLHPSIVRSIKHAVDAAHQAGIEVSLCGEMASDPYCIPILLGMQIDTISLNPQAIPGIKRIIRQTTMEECKSLLRQVLQSTAVSTSNHLVQNRIFQRFPEELTFFSSLLDTEEVPLS